VTRPASSLWEARSRIRDAIGDELAAGRCTQQALSAATGISQGQISNIIGRRRPGSILHLDMLAEAAGITIEATITSGQPSGRAARWAENHAARAREPA
jgi:transcriptional regulator with XRE-family HTH domain